MALTHLTESIIQRMLADASAKSLFPSCLHFPAEQARSLRKKCRPCRRSASRVEGIDLNGILTCFAKLSREGKIQLKTYLGAAKIRIRYRQGNKIHVVTW